MQRTFNNKKAQTFENLQFQNIIWGTEAGHHSRHICYFLFDGFGLFIWITLLFLPDAQLFPADAHLSSINGEVKCNDFFV